MMHPVLSREEILEAVTSDKRFYNNAQNVESPQIDAIHAGTDNDLLAQIGYKPELKRRFNTIQVFGVAFSIMGLLPSIATTLTYGLTAGPAGAIWGWLIASCFILGVGIAMSENASFQPTSGGLYYWTNFYAPPKLKSVLSFVIGNTNSLSLICGFCSIDYGFAQELLSIVVIAKDGDFEVTQAKTYGVFAACVIVHMFVTSLSSKHIATLQTTSIVWNVTLIAIFLIAMPIGASRGSFKSASWVFGNFENFTSFPMGWNQVSQAWQSAIWTIGAFDSCVHMSEECKNATKAVPVGIIGSISACGILGFIILIVTFFCVQTDDLESLMDTKFGQPMAQIIYDAFETKTGQGKPVAITFMVLITIGQFLMGASVLTAISRQLFAFARDNGLPFSWWIKKVNKKLSVPIHAVISGAVAALVVGCLALIGSTAASALFSLAVAGNLLAWTMPTFLRLIYTDKFIPGPFYLGKYLTQINGWVSVIYTLYATIMVMFPRDRNPNADTMNYTVVIAPGVWLLSLLYYLVYARKVYHGPTKTTDIDDDQETSSTSSIEQVRVAMAQKSEV
ncbi:hypothetical protein FT663_02996 [Candidozyma haemuli var. vulneris]|uniref:GABA-specific permease n=1 Tax=Candidozyma haemuli TaxID=45357 RepID=A0A2V1B1L6_9ASCO|nr:hypothetical protein CXQ85_004079 [[Candida] haemuloni]KAF3989062.1 hypothetical protein FT662_03036 [[Candida] haemuloni var. vulneris]KAF3990832.1 hypothetical protein FT663_02996 [[Candida] haemuloni var. vulneris]PVH23786.1 hypothetical protein CXQ85_004079 [[Candida] haemuloni]